MNVDFSKPAWPSNFAMTLVAVEPDAASGTHLVKLNGVILQSFPLQHTAQAYAAEVQAALMEPLKRLAAAARERCAAEVDAVARDARFAPARQALDVARSQIGRWV